MNGATPPIRGRGAAENPANRFDAIHYIPDPEEADRNLSVMGVRVRAAAGAERTQRTSRTQTT